MYIKQKERKILKINHKNFIFSLSLNDNYKTKYCSLKILKLLKKKK